MVGESRPSTSRPPLLNPAPHTMREKQRRVPSPRLRRRAPDPVATPHVRGAPSRPAQRDVAAPEPHSSLYPGHVVSRDPSSPDVGQRI
jgi:hypothetical protein